MILAVNKASLFFGGRAIFDEVSFQINPGDRIGLVGRNGAGKSTLLKLIAGDYSLDGGAMSKAKETRIAFLRQDLKMDMDKSIMDIARSAFDEITRINIRIEEINTAFEVRTDYESDSYSALIDELSELSERFGLLGGDSLDADIELVLKGLGFEPEVFELIDGDEIKLEDQPMKTLVEMGQLSAFVHDGFWQPMDTLREHITLEKLWISGDPPWLKD